MNFLVDLREKNNNQITIDLKQKYFHFQGFFSSTSFPCCKFNRNFYLTQLNFIFWNVTQMCNNTSVKQIVHLNIQLKFDSIFSSLFSVEVDINRFICHRKFIWILFFIHTETYNNNHSHPYTDDSLYVLLFN